MYQIKQFLLNEFEEILHIEQKLRISTLNISKFKNTL